jgi:hypothetical protein
MDFKNIKKKVREKKSRDFCQVFVISKKNHTLGYSGHTTVYGVSWNAKTNYDMSLIILNLRYSLVYKWDTNAILACTWTKPL